MDLSVVKSLLSKEFFDQHGDKIRPSFFEDEVKELTETVLEAHSKYDHDITPAELLALWRIKNPVATKAERGAIEAVLERVQNADSIAPDVASDVISALYQRDLGMRIADLGIKLADGDLSKLGELGRLMETADTSIEDEFGEPVTTDLDELLDGTGDEARFEFNLSTLSRFVYGIGPEEFGVIFATPESGKTAFTMSLACGPGGFAQSGRKVLYLGNEEAVKRTMLRAYMACTGMTRKEIAADGAEARRRFDAIRDNITFVEVHDWDLDKIERYISRVSPDVVFVDQADKVQISGKFEKGHERLRELYRRLREAAKRHKCAVLAVSQASNDAQHKTVVDYSMMEGSKIGKAAEADLIIGIGRHSGDGDDGPDNTRFVTVSKNKLSGWHGTIVCRIEPEISRFVE